METICLHSRSIFLGVIILSLFSYEVSIFNSSKMDLILVTVAIPNEITGIFNVSSLIA